MAPATGTALLILAAFLLPGFVALVYAERTYRTRADDSGFDRLLITLYYSALTYAGLVGGFLVLGLEAADVRELYQGEKSLESYACLALAALLLSLAIAEVARRWHRSAARAKVLGFSGVSPVHQTPSGWEHFFLTDTTAMVRVTLDDGRVIGGYFGPKSFAGYTADTPDLFLEQRWVLDDDAWFENVAPGTLGVYIRADRIVSVESTAPAADPVTGQTDQHAG